MATIYMDNHATTQCDPRVLQAMLPYFVERFGNAGSRHHSFGWDAEKAVKKGRESIAEVIGADESEIIFTSGATESDNLAIKGALESYKGKGNHIVTVATEHKAILETCASLEHKGMAKVTYLPVKADGLIDLKEVEAAITDRTILVSVMFANNEIGVLQPIAEIGALCHRTGVLFHSDAAQAVGKVPVDVLAMQIDLASLSAHKMYGPKGIGALYVRKRKPRVKLLPLVEGGGHERGFRSGTLPVPLIVGFGEAAALSRREMNREAARISSLRDLLWSELCSRLERVFLNGHAERRLPGNLNISFDGVESESLIMGVSDIAISTGSACTSATIEPSHVLKALGLSDERAHGTVRFGLGRFNTEEDVRIAIELVCKAVHRLRDLSPSYHRG